MENYNYNISVNENISLKIFRGDIFMAEIYSSTSDKEKWNVPVVIIQNDIGNIYSPTVIVATVTAKEKKNLVTHININLNKPSTIQCEDIHTIRKSQLGNWIGRLSEDKMGELDNTLMKSLGMVWIS